MIRRVLAAAAFAVFFAGSAQAFCGFYVAKADGALYNQASKVVFVRDGRKSVITMSSDYRGSAKDFAIIVPTPKVLKRDDVRTVETATVKHLVDYTAPRLVEYHDYDPCEHGDAILESPVIIEEAAGGLFGRKQAPIYNRADVLGVKIKAEYAVGPYDILILAAEESDGLATSLKGEGYKLPDGAEGILQRYIKGGMKFFVAKVNLQRHSAKSSKELSPLQISFRAPKFMLPFQLGKLNADGPQDALFFMLTRKGRVEVANYPQKSLPSDVDVPIFVEKVFPQFYKATFDRSVGAGGGVVMEYAWDMQWCDPCVADPLSAKELREL